VPDIKHSPRWSTGIVREFVGISENGARLPSFTLVQKLHSLDTVKPTDIVARMWEIIRCEYSKTIHIYICCDPTLQAITFPGR
jgi:hypothetical protein